jgi:Zn-dependent protease with chaperone function
VKQQLTDEAQYSPQQVAFIEGTIEALAKKANLRRTPELCISKNERLASVNIFQNRISVGKHFLSLWKDGKFNDADVEATIAHELGHLMDFRKESRSSSFRNLLCESLWLSFGVVPLVIYLLSPWSMSLTISAVLASLWCLSLPLIVRQVDVRIELEADRNAALHLVDPEKLANALVKISSLGEPSKNLGVTAKMAFFASTLTHPSFKERVRILQNL